MNYVLNELLLPTLIAALGLVEERLQYFAASPEFQSSMIVAFGGSHDYSKLQVIFDRKARDLLSLIEIVPLAALNGAYGAFLRDTNKIYLASELLNSATHSAIADVLLEEYGHYIDAQLNPIETIGDEGEIFADLVQGKQVNSAAFTEDDTEIVNIDGNWMTVEQAAGDLDPSLGGGGVAVSPFAGSPIGVVVQPDGKIIVGKNTDLGFARFNADGTIDTSFGNGGIVINNYGDDDTTQSIALQTDGKILVGGNPYGGIVFGGYVIRYNSNGTVDTSFDNNGVISIGYAAPGGAGNITKIEVQPDGKILVLYERFGFFYLTAFSSTNLRRYNSDGSLDTSFGDDGDIVISGEDGDGDLAIQSDGRILVAVEDDNNSVSIKRITADGKFYDGSWGGNGSVTTPITSDNYGSDDYRILEIQPDGKVLIAGDSILVRYNPNGSLDKMLTTTYNILGLTVQDNGKIVLLHGDGLSRFNSNLTPDISFGNGTVLPNPVGASEKHNLTLQGDGKILVAGEVNGFLSLARYQGDIFDAAQYGASYADLITGIGYNLDVLTQHYQNTGRSEGRQQDLFDEYRYIASSYVTGGDLIGAFALNGAAATQHYITSGYFESRSLTAFIPSRYLLSQADLLNLYQTDLQAASIHYITSGFAEGRNPNLFLSDRYIASHTDLIQAFGYNLELGSNHYLFSGRGEGRPITFSPEAYLSRYPDLQGVFGSDLVGATAHYITTGFAEGRT